jgi:NTP pyrophosphatase (non-canonical NTP hydrolase)
MSLSFDNLRVVNVLRCLHGFKHTLESWSVAEWTNALCGEAGEAANIAKKMIRHRDQVAGNKGADTDLSALREKLGRELADVVIYADLVAASQGLDLGECVRDTFNRKSEELGVPHRLYADPPASKPEEKLPHTFQPCDCEDQRHCTATVTTPVLNPGPHNCGQPESAHRP